MTNEERINYICFLQGAMRPMTEKEIAEMQKKNVPLMMNSQMSASGQAGMQNFWSQELGWEDGYKLAQHKKRSLWRKIARGFGAA